MNPHLAHKTSIVEMFGSLWRNRDIVLQMVKREVVGRYRGSVAGLAWSFFNPVIMLAVYTFVFSVVFKARWGVENAEKSEFAILLFVGMIVHGLFSECANRAPGLIVGNVSYVKKVVFPIEVLPWIAVGAALFHTMIGLAVLLGAQLLLDGRLPLTAIYFPIVLLPLVLASVGAVWLLSALGVYLRDVSQTVGILTTMLLFLSPVFYPISALPEKYQIWLQLNPLTYIIEAGRNCLILGVGPDWRGWSLSMLAGLGISWIGFWCFQKARRGFADVL